jgi:pyrimidine-specific ribonucleoside hydrolase
MANWKKPLGWLLLLFCISILSLACTAMEALTSLRDFLNTQVPESEIIKDELPQADATETPLIEPRMHVIWDDDGSPDGMIALMYFLHNPEVRVEAITVTAGEAYPQIFIPLVERALEKLGRSGIPTGAGHDDPLSGGNAFPDPWRIATNEFWGIDLPEISDPGKPKSAAELIVEVLNDSSEPMVIFVSGTHTNLAEALRMDPSIKDKIASVHVMGGALYIPGNIASDWPDNPNSTAEWNIWVDPTAADEVFSAGLPLFITPLDATKEVIFTRVDVGSWRGSAVPEGIMASELLNWMLDTWFPEGVYAWDVVTAVNTVHPEFCQSEELHVRVITDKGADEGRTLVVDGEPSNVTACLDPDSTAILAHIQDTFRTK